MTYPTEVSLPFADGTYRFFLPMPLVNEFEGKHGSIMMLEPRLRTAVGMGSDGRVLFAGGGDGEAKALRDLVRLALIGGGQGIVDEVKVDVGTLRAKELVEAYCYPSRPLGETATLVWRILAAAIYGAEPAAPPAKVAADV